MKNDLVMTADLPNECYVLQLNGEVKSEHRLFLDALRAGLQLKQMFPHSDVKVREQRTAFH
jgi:hypothetical protein